MIAALTALHQIGENAAALYLQLASLLVPSDSLVCRCGGWGKKEHTKAGKELVAKKLVIEAKRAKAGRSLFIPSAWLTKPLAKPFESWKNDHLALLDDKGSARGPSTMSTSLPHPICFTICFTSASGSGSRLASAPLSKTRPPSPLDMSVGRCFVWLRSCAAESPCFAARYDFHSGVRLTSDFRQKSRLQGTRCARRR